MNKPQLFCFTYAGGNANFFDIIEGDLPELEMIKFEYSGHGARHKEPLYNSFDELAIDLVSMFHEVYKGGKYALFGYSMGTISIVEFLKRLNMDDDIAEPSNVFLASHAPYTKAVLSGCTDEKMDRWVKERTIKFGAVPDTLKYNKSFWRVYLPLYRADYSMIGRYKFDEQTFMSYIPATFFYSETDISREDMELWKRYFVGGCDFHQYEGNHFFIRDNHAEMAQVIMEKLRKEG